MPTDNVFALDVGDRGRLTAAFTHPDTDLPIDPDYVFFRWKKPNGTTVTQQYGEDVEVVRLDEGIYRTEVPLDAAGVWYVRAWSTGEGAAAELGAFKVSSDPTS